MLIGLLSVFISLAVGYAYLREGIFTAFVMLVNVIASGLIAFNYFEPIADYLEPMVAGTFLGGYEDAFAMMALFVVPLGLLRYASNSVAPTEMIFPMAMYRIGGFVVGSMVGYLTAGFLVCLLQTFPWHENFMFFDPKFDNVQAGGAFRRFIPPDRVWLALMFRAGAYGFSYQEDPNAMPSPTGQFGQADKYLTFDKYGTFETRYARYRRITETRPVPMPYLGEFDQEIGKQ